MSDKRYLIVLLFGSLFACGQDNVKNVANVGDVPTNPCESVIDGEVLFLGSPECLKQLPAERMSGIWVVDHEYSVFYPSEITEIPEESFRDIWLLADVPKTLADHGFEHDGYNQIFRVEFIGTMSQAPGMYGSGLYERGALVLKMLSMERLPDDYLERHSVVGEAHLE